MGHLNRETLARLVGEDGSPEETNHIGDCTVCRSELAGLRDQTEALGNLPDLAPPPGDWPVLEARLRAEGLISDGRTDGIAGINGGASRPRGWPGTWATGLRGSWMTAAAALIVFFGGAFTGAQFGSSSEETASAGGAVDALASVNSLTTPEETVEALLLTEARYISLRAHLEDLTVGGAGGAPVFDPRRRFVALEHVAAVSQAALRQLPGDPYLNGLLVSVMGEREATIRSISSTTGAY